MSAATVRAGVEVQYRATGVESVKRATQDVTRSADAMKQRFGASAMQMSGALEMMARQGKVTGESLKQVAQQGGQVAFMFGPQGAIAGAILTLGVAMYSFWDRTRREMEETRKKAETEMRGLVNAGDYMGLNKRFREIETGTAANRYADGIVGRQIRIRDLKASIAAAPNRKAIDELYRQIKEEERIVAPMIAEREKLRALILDPRTGQLSSFTGMPAVTTTANAPGFRPKSPGKLRGIHDLYRLPKEKDMTDAMIGRIAPPPGLSQMADKFAREQTDNITGANIEAIKRRVTDGIQAAAEATKDAIGDFERQIETARTRLVSSIEDTLGSALENAFRRSFDGGGISGILTNFGRSIVASLGDVFFLVGRKLVDFGVIATAISEAIKKFGIFAGPGAIVAGLALMALGSTMGALAGGSSGGGGGGAGGRVAAASTGIVDRGLINPLNPLTSQTAQRQQAAVPITNNFTVIGTSDPRAQREIAQLIRNGARSGR